MDGVGGQMNEAPEFPPSFLLPCEGVDRRERPTNQEAGPPGTLGIQFPSLRATVCSLTLQSMIAYSRKSLYLFGLALSKTLLWKVGMLSTESLEEQYGSYSATNTRNASLYILDPVC